MFCPKCGAQNTDTNMMCENCNYLLQEASVREEPEVIVSKEIISVKEESNPQDHSQKKYDQDSISKKKLLGFLFIGVAVLVLLLSVISAILLFIGGSEIAQIQSVGGKTLDEAYYYRLQYVYHGFGVFVLSMGIFMSSVLTYLGIQYPKHETGTEYRS